MHDRYTLLTFECHLSNGAIGVSTAAIISGLSGNTFGVDFEVILIKGDWTTKPTISGHIPTSL